MLNPPTPPLPFHREAGFPGGDEEDSSSLCSSPPSEAQKSDSSVAKVLLTEGTHNIWVSLDHAIVPISLKTSPGNFLPTPSLSFPSCMLSLPPALHIKGPPLCRLRLKHSRLSLLALSRNRWFSTGHWMHR